MSEAKKIKRMEMGNPVIPNPPVPSQVRMSTVPEPPSPTPIEGEKDDYLPIVDTEPIIEEVDGGVDESPKGTIKINIYNHSPYEVEFDGIITGHELDMGWRAMMKQYRVWKHTMFKKIEEDRKGESDV